MKGRSCGLTVLLDLVDQHVGVGPSEAVHLAAIFNEDKGGHTANVVRGRQGGALVDVDLQHGAAFAVAPLDRHQLGRHLTTRGAPVGHKVSHNQLVARRPDVLIEVILWGRDE